MMTEFSFWCELFLQKCEYAAVNYQTMFLLSKLCPFKFAGAKLNSLYLTQSAVHAKQVCGSYILALFPLAGSISLTTWRSLKHRWAKGIEVCCFSSLASPCRIDMESALMISNGTLKV